MEKSFFVVVKMRFWLETFVLGNLMSIVQNEMINGIDGKYIMSIIIVDTKLLFLSLYLFTLTETNIF